MADVSRRRLREADRAQLFLIGALALSVIFVVLAVLLNTAIYTGNIATRDPGPGTGEVVEYEGEAKSMAATTLTGVNDRNNSSYSALRSNYSDTIAVWSDAANAHTVADLADAHTSVVTTTNGSKIGQSANRNFTSDTDAANWTVANDTRARAFRMNVTQSSLVNITVGSLDRDDSFYVGFNDSSGEWKAYVYQKGSSNVSVDVVHPNDTKVGSTCSVDAGADDHAVVELSTARVGGQPCPAFTTLFRGLSGSYNVTYGNAKNAGTERINGTYSVVVDRPLGELGTGADNPGEPYAAPALYSADLQVTYRSSVVYYRSNVSVAPEEPDV